MKKRLQGLGVLAVVCMALAFSSCDYSTLSNVNGRNYTEWRDDRAGIVIRRLDATKNWGYITLGGERVEACFTFGLKNRLNIIIPGEWAAFENDSIKARDEFGAKYEGDTIRSFDRHPRLFGYDFEQIVLTAGEIDRSTIDASEYMRVQWTDDRELLSFYVSGWGKSGTGQAVTASGVKDIIFVWEADRHFTIYEERLSSGQETVPPPTAEDIVARGTYTNVEQDAILTFTEDRLFDGAYPTLAISVDPAL